MTTFFSDMFPNKKEKKINNLSSFNSHKELYKSLNN